MTTPPTPNTSETENPGLADELADDLDDPRKLQVLAKRLTENLIRERAETKRLRGLVAALPAYLEERSEFLLPDLQKHYDGDFARFLTQHVTDCRAAVAGPSLPEIGQEKALRFARLITAANANGGFSNELMHELRDELGVEFSDLREMIAEALEVARAAAAVPPPAEAEVEAEAQEEPPGLSVG